MTASLPDAVGVVERLLARKGMYQMTGDSGWKVATWADADCQEAAILIQSLAARIAELEGAVDRLDQCLVAAQHGDPNAEATRRAQSQACSLLSQPKETK